MLPESCRSGRGLAGRVGRRRDGKGLGGGRLAPGGVGMPDRVAGGGSRGTGNEEEGEVEGEVVDGWPGVPLFSFGSVTAPPEVKKTSARGRLGGRRRARAEPRLRYGPRRPAGWRAGRCDAPARGCGPRATPPCRPPAPG